MKADDSMPFFGTAFFEAIEGYSDAVALGYIRALWHYWNHTHCQGLPDDDEYLQRICRCHTDEWLRTKGIIFDNQFFFCKNGTHWHQKKAKELHSKEIELYQLRVSLAQNARQQKAALSNPDSNANISPNVRRMSEEKELERIEARMVSIRDGARQVSTGYLFTTEEKAELVKLRARRNELRDKLGFKA